MTSEELSHFLHASSWQSSRLGLERMETLMTLLGHPERQLRFIHVAGTNGKGSIAAMLHRDVYLPSSAAGQRAHEDQWDRHFKRGTAYLG